MICAGFGFRSQAPFESFLEVLDRLEKEHSTGGPIGAIATIAHKAMAPVFKNLSAQKGLAIIAVHPDDITRQKTPASGVPTGLPSNIMVVQPFSKGP